MNKEQLKHKNRELKGEVKERRNVDFVENQRKPRLKYIVDQYGVVLSVKKVF